MIKFDLICENQHIFEASFDDSNSFEKQKRKKQIECPFCNSSTISILAKTTLAGCLAISA